MHHRWMLHDIWFLWLSFHDQLTPCNGTIWHPLEGPGGILFSFRYCEVTVLYFWIAWKSTKRPVQIENTQQFLSTARLFSKLEKLRIHCWIVFSLIDCLGGWTVGSQVFANVLGSKFLFVPCVPWINSSTQFRKLITVTSPWIIRICVTKGGMSHIQC